MAALNQPYDLIIIGGGPAGLTAAIYGGRAKLKTLVINKGVLGGTVDATQELVNYPGYSRTSGPELMADFISHAESFGAEFLRDEVVATDFSEEIKKLVTKKKRELLAKAVIIGVGSEPRVLNIPGEKELRGSGVSYCATCDAESYEGDHVVVVGSGDQAIEEGMVIAKYARQVTVIVLHDEGVLDCNKVSRERALRHEKMKFVWNSTIEEVVGDQAVSAVKIKNLKTGEPTVCDCQGVFFFVGMVPCTRWLTDSGLEMDSRGYIATNEVMETNLEGVYAAGDSRIKYLRQVVTAAGDGATAAVAAERYIDELHTFNTQVLQSEKQVLLLFLDAMDNESLAFSTLLEDVNQRLADRYQILSVDLATRKNLAQRYDVGRVPAVVVLDKGRELRRLDCAVDREGLISQLSDA
ncbi:MAG: FAD-dependent oxidoreductase [Desulfarculaceae bacterium]|nr:FAD-dependent oxidoreductase [Desulfarculaceae bacterium]MCF8049448.1 FAD-dependent oxidoreductase [Desulfarculaceae bacterium]